MTESQTRKEGSYWLLQGFGNPEQSFNGDDFFSALDFSEVFGIQVNKFSQLLLGQFGLLSAQPNCLTDDVAVIKMILNLSLVQAHCPPA